MKKSEEMAYTQSEANFYFEGPPIDIAQNYANFTKTVMISIFFMPILPIVLPFGTLAIITAFLMNKYLLFNRYAAPKATGVKINFDMYQYMDFVLVTFAVIFWFLKNQFDFFFLLKFIFF